MVAGLVAAVTACADLDERRTRLYQEVLTYGDQNCDATEHLVRDRAGKLNVVRGSLEYAAALLDTHRDAARASQVVKAVLFRQDGRPGSPTYGSFRWYADDRKVRDPDSVLFVAPWLAYLAENYSERTHQGRGGLDRDTEELAWDALPLALHAVRAREPDVQQTASYLMRIAALTWLGQLTRRPQEVSAAADALDEWLAFVAQHGIGEYNSPRPLTESIVALQWLWQVVRNRTTQQRAEMALHVLYERLLQHYHAPSGLIAGACNQAFESEYTLGQGPARYLLWYQLGQPPVGQFEPYALVHAVQTYRPGDDLLHLAAPDSYPREVPQRLLRRVGRGVMTDTYLTGNFSLGTQSGEGGPSQVPILWTYQTTEPRASGFLYPLPSPTPLNSVQERNAAICCFLFGERQTVGEGFRGVWGSLGPEAAVPEVLIGGQPWDRQSVGIAPHTPICAKVYHTYVALVPLEVDALKITEAPLTPERPVALRLAKGEVAFGIAVRAASGLGPGPTQPLRAGVAIRVESGDRFDSLADFARFIASGQLQETRSGPTHTVTWTCGDTHLVLQHDLKTLEMQSPSPAAP